MGELVADSTGAWSEGEAEGSRVGASVVGLSVSVGAGVVGEDDACVGANVVGAWVTGNSEDAGVWNMTSGLVSRVSWKLRAEMETSSAVRWNFTDMCAVRASGT